MSRQLDNTATENPLSPINLCRLADRQVLNRSLCRLLAFSSSFSMHRLLPASLFIGFLALFTTRLPASQISAPPPSTPPLSAELILHRALDARGGEAAAAQIRSFH